MSKNDRIILFTGILLSVMEFIKQLFLYFIVFNMHYDVWYFPFQLCSTPMYLCLFYGLSASASKGKTKRTVALFIQDFGVLGGIMALLVHDGFTWTDYPLLTLHGYLWHIILILLGIFIFKNRLSYTKKKDFLKTVPLFLILSAVAELINIILSSESADCDMFYISPFHPSSQPVFHQLDLVIGRIPGIFMYLACVISGAFIIHLIFCWLDRKLGGASRHASHKHN